MATREDVAIALFNLVDAAAGKVADVRTSSRQLVDYQQVDPAQTPAVFLVQRGEKQVRDAQGTPGIGLPAKRWMKFEVWLYTADAQSAETISVQQLNNIIDSVELALAQPDNFVTNAVTLGGLVTAVRIDGDTEYYVNVLGGPTSVAIVPVSVLRP